MFDLSQMDLRVIVAQMIALILSIAVHEFGHAIVADRLGDGLPRSEGRVTLNPMAHADPIGTLLFPALGLLASGGASFGFGWGRPVRTNPAAYSRKFRMKHGHLLVAAAGPAMNLLFGTVILGTLAVLLGTEVLGHGELMTNMIGRAAALNFILAFFNLIPAPPLDGGAVLQGLLPDKYSAIFEKYAPYGIFVLFAVILIPKLAMVFVWPALQVFNGLAAVFGLPLRFL